MFIQNQDTVDLRLEGCLEQRADGPALRRFGLREVEALVVNEARDGLGIVS